MENHETKLIELSAIGLSFDNSRQRINKNTIDNLKASILKLGLLQPLVVSHNANGGYTLIAGFTRHRALQELNQQHVQVTIIEGDDLTKLECHIAENANREDLSFVSTVHAIRRIATETGGDYAEVAQRLGFSKKVMEDRIALTKCDAIVLDALDKQEIKVGHAVLLSSFTNDLQKTTLEKIIAESWTVEHLRERANKARIKLAAGKFDKEGCRNCSHNSDYAAQNELFGETIPTGHCSNTVCFREKQTQWLDQRYALLAEEHGVVLKITTMDSQGINGVTPDKLGQPQYNACQACPNNVTIVDDRLGSVSVGDVRTQMCNNVPCFQQNIKDYAQASSSPLPPAQTNTESKVVKNVSKTAEATTISATLGKKQIEDAEAMLSSYALNTFPVDEHLVLSVAYLTIGTLCGHNLGSMSVLNALNNNSDSDTMKSLSEMLNTFLNKSVSNTSTHLNSPRVILQKLLHNHGNHKQNILHAWTPSALANYPTRQVIFLCEEAGFAKNYDQCHGEGAFNKLQKGNKSNLLEAIATHTQFSWLAYAPSAYRAHFNQK